MECFIYYNFEDFRLDVENQKLLKNNQPVLLTQKTFSILLLLVKNAGQLVKKEQIIAEIWHDSFVEDSNITQQIYLLRKTLGNDANGNPFIETLPKRGYSFVGKVTEFEAIEQLPAVKETVAPVSAEKAENHSDESVAEKTRQKTFFIYGAIALILLTAFGAFVFWRSKNPPIEESGVKSIAVLPFRKIGNETDDSKIEFGLADAVINNLSKQQKIPVRSMSAVFQYAGKDSFDAIEAGKNLGVDSVLEGTVQREGEDIRVSLRLLKVSDGSTVWAEVFNEKLNHIFDLQDSISAKVVRSLAVSLPVQSAGATLQQPANPEAFQFYQLGVYFSNTRTKDGLIRAISYFQKTLELDAAYAPAYANLADAYNWLNEFEAGGKRQEYLDKSEEAAGKALMLDNSLAEAHIAIAFVQFVKYKDYEAGKKSLEKATELAPYNPTARLHYGWELLQRGDLEGGYQQTVLAQKYSPLSAYNNLNLCSLLIFKRDYPQALQFCQKTAELQPTTPFVNTQIANILFLTGKSDEAVNLLKLESENESQKYYAQGSLAYIYAKTGKPDEAEKIYRELKESRDSFQKFSDLTLVAFTLGKKDEAVEHFKRAIEIAAIPPTYLLFDPFWEEIFKDETFRQMVARK